MSDKIEACLKALQGESLVARTHLDETAKLSLIDALGGPRTALSIRQAMKVYAVSRIPFLFSSLDPQLVVDLMANDVDALLQSLIERKKAERKRTRSK